MWLADRNIHGGGVLAFLRSDLAGDHKPTFEFKDLESVGVEVTSNGNKWLFVGTYKTPNISENAFRDDFSRTLRRILS
jgi:hypothetical protein